MKTTYYDGDTFERKGYTFRVELQRDEDMREPWNESDGHGKVSEWTRRDKTPGERVLCEDRSSKRFYDFAGAVRLARKDGWGCKHTKVTEVNGERVIDYGHATAGERANCAAETDYDYLRRWCNDDWHYLTVGVTHVDTDEDGNNVDGETEYLGGVESSDMAYVADICNELADEIISRLEVDEPDVVLSEN